MILHCITILKYASASSISHGPSNCKLFRVSKLNYIMVIFGDFYMWNNRNFAIYIPLTTIYIPQLKRIEHVFFKKKLKMFYFYWTATDDYGLIPNATGYRSALGNIQSNTVREKIHLNSNQTVQNVKNKNLTLQIASSGHGISAQNFKSIWYIHLVLFKENTMCLLWRIYVLFKDEMQFSVRTTEY